MFTVTDFLAAIVLPAGLTASLLIFAWRLTHHRCTARDSRSWSGPAAAAIGFVAGCGAMFGWPPFPPHDAVDWLPWIAFPLAVGGLLDSYYRIAPPARVLLIAVGVPMCLLLVSWPLLTHAQTLLDNQLMLATGLSVASMLSLDFLSKYTTAGRFSTLLLAVLIPAAAVLAFSGSIRLALMAIVLAATQLGTIGAHLLLGRSGLGRGIVVVVGTLLAGVLWSGYLYAQVTASNAILLAIAPNMAWLGPWIPRRYGRLAHVAIQTLAVLAIGGIAMLQAWRASI